MWSVANLEVIGDLEEGRMGYNDHLDEPVKGEVEGGPG